MYFHFWSNLSLEGIMYYDLWYRNVRADLYLSFIWFGSCHAGKFHMHMHIFGFFLKTFNLHYWLHRPTGYHYWNRTVAGLLQYISPPSLPVSTASHLNFLFQFHCLPGPCMHLPLYWFIQSCPGPQSLIIGEQMWLFDSCQVRSFCRGLVLSMKLIIMWYCRSEILGASMPLIYSTFGSLVREAPLWGPREQETWSGGHAWPCPNRAFSALCGCSANFWYGSYNLNKNPGT